MRRSKIRGSFKAAVNTNCSGSPHVKHGVAPPLLNNRVSCKRVTGAKASVRGRFKLQVVSDFFVHEAGNVEC